MAGPGARAGDGGEDRHLRIERQSGRGDGRPPVSGMDVRREPRGPGRRIAAVLSIMAIIALITILLSRIEPAYPVVDRDLLALATVERGPLPLEVRGWGELLVNRMQPIETTVSGRVSAVHVSEGDLVPEGAILVELSNPDLALALAKAEQEYTAAQAAFTALRRSIGTQRLDREAKIVSLRAELKRADRAVGQLKALHAAGEVDEEEVASTIDFHDAIEDQLRVEEETLALLRETGDEQVQLEKERLLKVAEVLEREKERMSALTIEAPTDALVKKISTAVGDWVAPGSALVSMVRPELLQAEVKVPKDGAERVEAGDAVVVVDAVGDTTGGRVELVDEKFLQTGDQYVRVTVQLDDSPDADAVLDAGVDAVISTGLLEDALFVKRPAWASDHGKATVFRVSEDGTKAKRVKVRFGAGSWGRIEVLEGLEEGDVVIVSDMSRFDDVDVVRLKP